MSPALFDADAAFLDASEAARLAFLARIDTQPVPARLFQYTDYKGLVGVLQTRRLWATHYRHLNDAKEGVYADELLNRVFAAARGPEFPERPSTPAEWASFVRGLVLHFPGSPLPDMYPVSFTSRKDDLNQWRAYAANGTGFAIGFDGPGIVPGDWMELSRVEYAPSVQAAALEEALMACAVQLNQHAGGQLQDEDAIWQVASVGVGALRSVAAIAAAVFKHPAFRDEDEWRLALLAEPDRARPALRHTADAQTRMLRGKEVPYFETRLGPDELLPIRSIDIGPKVDFVGTAPAVWRLLEEFGYDPATVEVQASEVPYR